ncbi:hypothetical protein QTP88_009322 [Uroleucon formosanum]
MLNIFRYNLLNYRKHIRIINRSTSLKLSENSALQVTICSVLPTKLGGKLGYGPSFNLNQLHNLALRNP